MSYQEVLSLCKDAIGVFFSPRSLGFENERKQTINVDIIYVFKGTEATSLFMTEVLDNDRLIQRHYPLIVEIADKKKKKKN